MTVQELGAAFPVLAVLAALSVVSVAVFLSRLMALRGVMAGSEDRKRWLEQAETGSASEAPQGSAPASRVARRAVELLSRDVSRDAIEAELIQTGNVEVASMAKGIRFLELTGMIAPLLGLLGTVLGMIQSFRSLELAEGAANASILAGGIWQALLTTAAGLVVAIPALAAATILQARVERGTQEIEQVIGRAALLQAMRAK